MKSLSLLIPLFLMSCVCFSQQSPERQNSFRLGAGRYFLSNLDLQASPLLYKANATTLLLAYWYQSDRTFFSLDLSPSMGSNRPKNFGVREYEGENYHFFMDPMLYTANFAVQYQRRVNRRQNARTAFYLGGSIEESLFVSDAVANFYWSTNMLSFNIAGSVVLNPLPKHRLRLQTSVPVYSFISRAVYANFPKSNNFTNFRAFFEQGTRGASPDKFQRIRLDAEYMYDLSSRFDLGVSYQFSWFRYPYPQLIKAYSSQLLLQTAYKF